MLALAAFFGLLTLQDSGPSRLSLADLAERALRNNALLRREEHRFRSVEQTAQWKESESTWQGWDLTLEGEYYPTNDFASQVVGYDERMRLYLSIPLFGSQAEREIAHKVVQGDSRLIHGEWRQAERDLLISLLGHYVSFSRGKMLESGLKEMETRLREKTRVVSLREKAGESIPSDRLAAERDLADVLLRQERNHEAMQLALEGIRNSVGEPSLPAFEPLAMPWQDFEEKSVPDLETLVEKSVSKDPQVQGLREKVEILAKQAADTESVFPRSGLSLGYVGQWQDSDFNHGPGLTFFVSVPLGYSKISQARHAATTEEKSRYLAEIDRKTQDILSAVRMRYQELVTQQERARFSRSQLRLANEQERVAKLHEEAIADTPERSYLLGRMDSEINSLDARMQREGAQMEIASSYLKLLLSLGEEVSFGTLSLPFQLPAGISFWVWDGSVLDSNPSREKFFSTCERWKAGSIFLSLNQQEQDRFLNGSKNDVQSLRRFLSECHEKGFKVEFLQGENSWADPGEREGFRNTLQALRTFQAGAGSVEGFDALHLDVEPYALQSWKESPEKQLQLARGLVSLMQESRSAGLRLVCDVPSWYEKIPIENSNLLHKLLETVDGIVVMNYRTQMERFVKEAEDELSLGNTMGKKVKLGISVESMIPEGQAFKSGKALEDFLFRAARQISAEPSFAGFAIQDYRDFELLTPTR